MQFIKHQSMIYCVLAILLVPQLTPGVALAAGTVAYDVPKEREAEDETKKKEAEEEAAENERKNYQPLITSDAVIFGILMLMLGAIFLTCNSPHPFWKKFYTFVPMLLLCYFLPSLLTTFHVVNPNQSKLYEMAKNYLLPACLILLTISIDFREILRLGPKALIMFATGTVGVVIGGPIAVLVFAYFMPEVVGGTGPDAAWRGLSTVAGSWIGGGANQAAMEAIFKPSGKLYGIMVTVDILVAEAWMVFLLIGVGKADAIDRWFKADSSSIETLKQKMEKFSKSVARIPETKDIVVILGIAFGITAACHLAADTIAPFVGENYAFLSRFSFDSKLFWLIVLATSAGLGLSFTKLREYEGVGASKIGTLFIFVLVATIGLKMNVLELFDQPGYFALGALWMIIHVGLMVFVGWLIRAPYFFLAVGSKANIGGAASAPVVAAAFHPSLAPVGVLLAVLGYAAGTYGAWLCALMMQAVSP